MKEQLGKGFVFSLLQAKRNIFNSRLAFEIRDVHADLEIL